MSRSFLFQYMIYLGMIILISFRGGSQIQQRVHSSESEERAVISNLYLPMNPHVHNLSSDLSVSTRLYSTNQEGSHGKTMQSGNEAISSNYAGYAVQQGGKTFENVSGSWTMPEVQCPQGQSSEAAFWVGLTGRGGQNTIAQVATIGSCQNGQAKYEADWEFFPEIAQTIGGTIRAGDQISASVSYRGGKFHLILTDAQQGWNFSVSRSGSASSASVAECITEAPTLIAGKAQQEITNLANFGSVSISCQADGMPIGSYTQLFQYQMVAENATGSTSEIDGSGSVFSVTWGGK